ncbi:hypothetical protein [Muriicola soli]|uniref:Uncharacterized protein n=1 Tax=Muriicola soli TaxID=2507538 RepID=A0A411E902_9FLAO|nr:hypothetical protein [Muriicola soli]QBA64169.1 hypothetical protein EQY75_06270 [Muriicola soli]
MELQELEKLWTEMSQELESQKKLNKTIIMDMTQTKYVNKFRKISTYETIGAVICIAAALYIITQFNLLDTWYLQLCGAFTVTFLIILPILTLQSLQKIQNIDLAGSEVKETIIRFERAKKRVLYLQRAGIYLSFILMITILPVAAKISGKGKDLFQDPGVLYVYIPVMVVFLVLFARWGYGCYKSITTSAENILKEIE